MLKLEQDPTNTKVLSAGSGVARTREAAVITVDHQLQHPLIYKYRGDNGYWYHASCGLDGYYNGHQVLVNVPAEPITLERSELGKLLEVLIQEVAQLRPIGFKDVNIEQALKQADQITYTPS